MQNNLTAIDLERDIQKFKLPGPLLVSRLEERLPFGMMRRIPMIGRDGKDDFDAANLIMSMKNPVMSIRKNPVNTLMTSMNVPMTTIQPNTSKSKHLTFTEYKQLNFNPAHSAHPAHSVHSVHSARPTLPNSHIPTATALYFDQSLVMFTRDNGAMNPTLISSNFNGSVSGDRQHFGAILRTGCWLLPTGAALAHPRLPPTANNKLKLIKCAEFMAREWPTGVNVSQLGGLAIVRPERAVLTAQPNLLSVVGAAVDGGGGGLYWMVLNRRSFGWKDHLLPFSFTAQEGDWLVLMRSLQGAPSPDFLSDLKELLLVSDALDDLEVKVKEILPTSLTALLLSRISFPNRLDHLISPSVTGKLSHVTHLDSRRGGLTADVEPGRFGSTTRHCVIFRPPFLAALHHDASKINRFAPTIDYIIKKVLREGRLDLRRISEIQYYAYVISKGGYLYCVVGGGACIVLLEGDNGSITRVIEEAQLIYKLPCPRRAQIMLLSPHLYTLRNHVDPKASLLQYCRERQIDLHHPKLSFAQFSLDSV
jgi:hypothetical protein